MSYACFPLALSREAKYFRGQKANKKRQGMRARLATAGGNRGSGSFTPCRGFTPYTLHTPPLLLYPVYPVYPRGEDIPHIPPCSGYTPYTPVLWIYPVYPLYPVYPVYPCPPRFRLSQRGQQSRMPTWSSVTSTANEGGAAAAARCGHSRCAARQLPAVLAEWQALRRPERHRLPHRGARVRLEEVWLAADQSRAPLCRWSASCAAALQFRIAWQSPNAAALHSHAFSPALMPSAGASLQLS